MLADVGQRNRRHVPAQALGGDGLRIGMTRARRHGGGHRQAVGSDAVGIDQLRHASGERAGLVEDDMVGLGQPLQGAAVLDHDAALEQAARRDHLDHRHGKPERAGTGDDEDGDGHRDGAMRVPVRIIQPTKVAKAVTWITGA